MENKDWEFPISLKILSIVLVMTVTFGYSLYQKGKYLNLGTGKEEVILKKLPDISMSRMDKSEGRIKEVLEKTNKGIFVHFWGTWCAPCEEELPSFLEFARKFKDKGLSFLFFAINDSHSDVKKFVSKLKDIPDNVSFWIDNDGKSLENFGVLKVPETFIFDSKGVALKKFVGPQNWDSEFYSDFITDIFQLME
jgi:cytochrome c biogenesis protein CcmG, thiol:disulfide interchange protein DsbE